MFRKLVIIAFVLGLAGGALAVIIGDPTAGNGWNCRSAITATASFAYSGADANDTIAGHDPSGTGDGLDAATGLLHGVRWWNMWYVDNNDSTASVPKYDAGVATGGPVWIAYEFDAVYTLNSMTIWNYNGHNNAPDPNETHAGIEQCVIEYSTNGTSWTTLGTTHTLTRAPGEGHDGNSVGGDDNYDPAEYAAVDTISFGGVQAKYVVLTAVAGASGTYDPNGDIAGACDYGLSEVRFTADANYAWAPDPYHTETDIATDKVLSWTKGDGSDIVKHRVWISTNQSWVSNRDSNATNVVRTVPNYDPDLEAGRTYFWAVDELDSGESIVTGGNGRLWQFTAPYCLSGTEPNDLDGNLNGDCFIDFKDFAIMAYNWELDGFWP